MPMEDLSSVLWRERELLDRLLFKLEVEQLVLTSGRSHWLPLAAREIEAVLDDIRNIELLRAVALDNLAAELGIPANPSLRDLSEHSPEPWKGLWLDHREAFTTSATAISQMSQSNRVLLTAGYQAAQATLLSMEVKSPTYSADGSVSSRRRSFLDRAL
jgi:hypothetical protein